MELFLRDIHLPLRHPFTIALGTTTAVAAAGMAAAEYPERPIQMIVAYNPGGGTDVAARTLAPFIEKHLGNNASITILNKPGAGGEVGFTTLAQSEPDGYTIGFINTPVLNTIPIERQARYTLDSFEPIGNVVYDPGVFVVLADSGIKTLDDLVAAAKDRPGELTYATTGIGSDDHLAMLKFQRLTGTELQHVPFEGSAPARAALLGGHVDVGVINAGAYGSDALIVRPSGVRLCSRMPTSGVTSEGRALLGTSWTSWSCFGP